MIRVEKIIEELCPNGVEYVAIEEICDISRGQVMSKDFIRENAGEYPVYSSQTENNGELGKISTYMFDGEYLTWTTDGANAGAVFYRNGKFSVTNVCGLLKVKTDKIMTKFLYYALSIANGYVRIERRKERWRILYSTRSVRTFNKTYRSRQNTSKQSLRPRLRFGFSSLEVRKSSWQTKRSSRFLRSRNQPYYL